MASPPRRAAELDGSRTLNASRNRARAKALRLVVAGLALACVAKPAHAALGETAASIESDQRRLAGALRTTASPGYLLHEIATPTGTLVREFTSADGAVFGVAWEGPFLPDLQLILGPSYASYLQAARVKRRGRGPLLIRLPELVLESAGHPRGFHGRAYVPELLPAGVAAEAVR